MSDSDSVLSKTRLQQRLSALEQKTNDLQLVLDMTIEHSDMLLETLRQDNRRLALEAIAANRQTDALQQVLDVLPVGVIIARVANGEIIYGNRAICQRLGVSALELVSRRVTDFCAETAEPHQLVGTLSTQPPEHIRWRNSDGSGFDAAVSCQPLVFNNDPAVLLMLWS